MRNGGRYSNLEGKFTSTVYGLIRDGKYADAIKILSYQLQLFPRNRAALSLIGYSQYYMQDFLAAAQTYELLVKHHPGVVEYKLYYAQSLLKAGMHSEANKIATQIDHPQYTQRIQHLKACIAFEQGELETCKALIERNETVRDDPNTIVSRACVEFKEGKFDSARKMFMDAISIVGYQANLAYNVALCYYMERQFGSALKHIAEIIEKGVREHPELSVGSNTEQLNVRSVGNSQVLQETALIEAFNLKAAIEYVVSVRARHLVTFLEYQNSNTKQIQSQQRGRRENGTERHATSFRIGVGCCDITQPSSDQCRQRHDKQFPKAQLLASESTVPQVHVLESFDFVLQVRALRYSCRCDGSECTSHDGTQGFSESRSL